MNRWVQLATLWLTLLAAVPMRAGVQPPSLKVPNKAPAKASSFRLQDVRLLEGPFRDAMLRDQKYLLSLDVERLLHNFRVNAGIVSTAKPLGGWEAPDVELRGHSLGHYLSASAAMYASTGDDRFKVRADAVVAELAKIQRAMASRFNPGYLSAFPEELIDRVEARERVWAPYYTLHKIMAGLLDVHLLCGNPQALEVLLKQADWVRYRMDRLSEEQREGMLGTEFGGMNEVLANVYAVTGDPDHLRTARAFDHRAVFDPLSRGEDPLDGLHANTQIPKAIGAAREYELTGERRYRDIATFFWQRVARHRSYVVGGHSDGERFFPIGEFSRHLGASSAETCNTYNMLKLTRHLFSWEPSVETMDFYERGLFNHILASQDPATGMVIYYCPLKPGAFKTFSTEEDSFWCCVGTGMENHARYGDTIYFHDERSLSVNLFIASELTWREKGLVVRQQTRFPEEDATRLTLKTANPLRLALKIRYPSWATSGLKVSINGRGEPVPGEPGSYFTVDREWRDGDTVEVRAPMSLRAEPLPGEPTMVALLYGPIVLAGDLGKEGLEGVRRYGPLAPPLGRVAATVVPAFVATDVRDVLRRTKPVSGAALEFRTEGLARPREVSLVPFYKLFEPRYTVYFKMYSPGKWKKHLSEKAAADARRKEIERSTVEAIDVGDAESEKRHGLRGEGMNQGSFEGRRWREARNGWFSYELRVLPDRPLTLLCTYRGSEGRRRSFDILVDGEKVASDTLEYHPTELVEREYRLPESLTRGKERVTVKFQSHPESTAGSLFEVRIVERAAASR